MGCMPDQILSYIVRYTPVFNAAQKIYAWKNDWDGLARILAIILDDDTERVKTRIEEKGLGR
jgi:hypothetical protein